MRPDLGQIEWVQVIRAGVFLGHDLYVDSPAREVFVFDGFEQVALRTFTIFADKFTGLGVGQVLDPLLSLEGEFDPETFVVGIDEAESMAAEKVHVAEARRDASDAHDDRKSVVWGKGVSVREDLGGRRTIKKKNTRQKSTTNRR